jgi:hypothetical protein
VRIKHTLSKVRRDRIDFHVLSANQTDASLLIAIHTTQPRTEIAFAQMCICLRALLRGIDGADEVIARDVVVEEPGWCKVQGAMSGAGEECIDQCGSKAREQCHVVRRPRYISCVDIRYQSCGSRWLRCECTMTQRVAEAQ